MPISGTIQYDDFTVYLQMSMSDLTPSQGGLVGLLDRMAPPVGITVDIHQEGGAAFYDLLINHMNQFNGFLAGILPRSVAGVGIFVIEMGATVNPSGLIVFKGTARRPTMADFQKFMEFTTTSDVMAKQAYDEHLKVCSTCAKEEGVEPPKPRTTIFGSNRDDDDIIH